MLTLTSRATHLLTTRCGTPVLGSLSERRSASATPTRAANPAPMPAFNAARRDPPWSFALSWLLDSTAPRTSPKQPGPRAILSLFKKGDQLLNRSPGHREVVGASFFPRCVADVRAVGDHDRDLRCA
jgi:hypothetical protein